MTGQVRNALELISQTAKLWTDRRDAFIASGMPSRLALVDQVTTSSQQVLDELAEAGIKVTVDVIYALVYATSMIQQADDNYLVMVRAQQLMSANEMVSGLTGATYVNGELCRRFMEEGL